MCGAVVKQPKKNYIREQILIEVAKILTCRRFEEDFKTSFLNFFYYNLEQLNILSTARLMAIYIQLTGH